ncbi:MAG: hypothetical protein JSR47_24215 [Proteobacteria bacterium]|nr:hypothetical protein [Pseudomonadota bacterium]
MQLKGVAPGEATITFSVDEIFFLCHAISEAKNALSALEFKTRTRETPERAKEIWQQLLDVTTAVAEGQQKNSASEDNSRH